MPDDFTHQGESAATQWVNQTIRQCIFIILLCLMPDDCTVLIKGRVLPLNGLRQLVASLPTRVNKLCSHCLSQVVKSMQQLNITICNNLVDIIRLVARLFQQVWYSHDITVNNIVTTLCGQPCNILVILRLYQTCWNNLATSLIMSSSLLQVVNSLFQTCCNNMGASSANTTCWQLANRFVTTCLQTC